MSHVVENVRKYVKLNSRINDPSHWLTSERVQGYLERADKIPHRSEGEYVLLDFIPNTTKKVLDLGTGDGRLIKLLKRKIPSGKYVAIDFSPPNAQDSQATICK